MLYIHSTIRVPFLQLLPRMVRVGDNNKLLGMRTPLYMCMYALRRHALGFACAQIAIVTWRHRKPSVTRNAQRLSYTQSIYTQLYAVHVPYNFMHHGLCCCCCQHVLPCCSEEGSLDFDFSFWFDACASCEQCEQQNAPSCTLSLVRTNTGWRLECRMNTIA